MNEFQSLKERIQADCLRLLTLREHSQQELFQKLTNKGYPPELVRQVIDECAKNNWQSDQRYAENYARQRQQKGFGKLRVNYELKQRGIDITNLCNPIDDDFELLEQLYLKKYTHDVPLDKNEWAKRYRFLLQRGFPANQINELFKRLQHKVK